jgi:hypothetical protein
MLVTNHVLAGAVLGAALRRPALAFSVGVVSHFGMDRLPHWGPDEDHDYFLKIAVRDGLCGLAALAALAAATPASRRLAVLAGAIGAALPDLDKPVKEYTRWTLWPARVNAFHAGIQREAPSRMPVELTAAAALSLAVTALLARRPSSGSARLG